VKKILYTVIISILLIAGISLVVLYNFGDRIIEEAIKVDLTKSNDDSKLSNNQELSGSDNKQVQNDAPKSTYPPGNEHPLQVMPKDNSGQPPKAVSQTTEGEQQLSSPVLAAQDGGQSAEATPVTQEQEVIPSQKVEEIKDKVSTTDKLSAAALVLKRLSPSDIQQLEKMVANGLDSTEKAKAEQLVYSKFAPAEIEQIKQMYDKYMGK